MKFDAVLFDAAETLFTTRGSVGEIYGRVACDYGCMASTESIEAAFLRQFQHSGPLSTDNERAWWRDVVHRVFSDVGMVRSFEDFFSKVYDQFRDDRGWVLFPETRETLAELKSRNLKLGVISNFDSRVYEVLRHLDILTFFDTVTISSETGYAKPDPEIFEAAIRALGFAASRVLLIGDSLRDDVQAGLRAGIHSLLIDRKDRYSNPGVSKISSLREVLLSV
jgi:putative hydrolase of the HAD superfamily